MLEFRAFSTSELRDQDHSRMEKHREVSNYSKINSPLTHLKTPKMHL